MTMRLFRFRDQPTSQVEVGGQVGRDKLLHYNGFPYLPTFSTIFGKIRHRIFGLGSSGSFRLFPLFYYLSL
jgi:hypothetical protein